MTNCAVTVYVWQQFVKIEAIKLKLVGAWVHQNIYYKKKHQIKLGLFQRTDGIGIDAFATSTFWKLVTL